MSSTGKTPFVEDEAHDSDDIDTMSWHKMRNRCKALGLNATGRTHELRQRLKEAQAADEDAVGANDLDEHGNVANLIDDSEVPSEVPSKEAIADQAGFTPSELFLQKPELRQKFLDFLEFCKAAEPAQETATRPSDVAATSAHATPAQSTPAPVAQSQAALDPVGTAAAVISTETSPVTPVIARWFGMLLEVNPKTQKEYYFTGLQIAERENLSNLGILKLLKIYGNRAPGPHAIAGLKSGGAGEKDGFRTFYNIRIAETALHLEHTSLQGFREVFARQSAAVNNGVPVPLEIVGITELPTAQVRVVTSGNQVGLQGATYLLSKLINIRRVGVVGNSAVDTFTWEAGDKVYVCNQPWSAQRVYELLLEAKQTHFPTRNIDIVHSS